jgi:hypothetical protein
MVGDTRHRLGQVRDDEHDIENRPGHWEGVVALWPHEDPTFPALTWEREDSPNAKFWIMLGPNDPDPSEAEITEERHRRHEDWQQGLQRKREAGEDA